MALQHSITATAAETSAIIAVEPPAPRALAQIDDVPLHVSLVAIIVIALCICWDRRHAGHQMRPR